MKYILIFVFIIAPLKNTKGQKEQIQEFGNTLALSIKSKDSILFKSLVIPKEGTIDILIEQSENISPTERKEITNLIHESYEFSVLPNFMFKFFLLTKKTEIFDLEFNDLNFRIIETEETKEQKNIHAVYASLNHDKFKHFTFYVYSYKGNLYLPTQLIDISEVNKFEQRKQLRKVELSADETGHLISEGSIILENSLATKDDILSCYIDNSLLTIGLTEHSYHTEHNNAYEFVKGSWEYIYAVNDLSDEAGSVAFTYEFKIFDDRIDYLYSDYIHTQGDSNFKSLGQLPLKINEQVKQVFTSNQYDEILNDVHLNVIAAVKRTKEYLDKCLKQ